MVALLQFQHLWIPLYFWVSIYISATMPSLEYNSMIYSHILKWFDFIIIQIIKENMRAKFRLFGIGNVTSSKKFIQQILGEN